MFARPVGIAVALAAVCGWLVPVAGCGGGEEAPPPSAEAASGPHGGPVVTLPGDAGVAEVVCEFPKTRQATLDARVVVYFLKPGGGEPMATVPTDVSVQLRTPDKPDPIDIRLSPDPQAKDAARFVSEVGPYGVDRLIGTLKATVAGQPFDGPFASAR